MNYKFFALLATLSIFILSCRDTKKTSQTQNPKRVFKGNVVIGHGHLYWVEYHYNTEGQDMVQELVFKKIQQGYLRGFGELYEDNGVYRIDRSKEINFATGLFFRKTDCP